MICLVSLTSHPSEAEFDSFVSRPPRPSALSLIFQATAALGKLSPLGADTDTGYKLQHKPGRLGTMLQPLSSRLPSGRATSVQAEHHRAVETTKLSSLITLLKRYSVLSEDDHVGRKASEHDVISEGSLEVEN